MNLDELDDFNNLNINDQDTVLSNLYEVKIGGFGLNDFVRTFFSSVKVKELKEDIKTFDELKREKSWPVSQIIQREIDKFRVHNISKDYILSEGRSIKYFPPITIAILPKSNSGMIAAELRFESDLDEAVRDLIYKKSKFRNEEKIRDYFLNAENISKVDGISLLRISDSFDYNVLCWDKTKHYAVVIDGQHRLESLIGSISHNETVSNFKQDIIFIDLTNLIEQNREITPVEGVRRVFVDINNTSVKVGNVRRILMDDKDLGAIFVQSLVNEFNRMNDLKEDGHYIPSQLIDWYGDSLKHNLPHLTGILTLYQLMTDYVLKTNLISIKDLRSKGKVKKWTQRINQLFKVDDQIRRNSQYKDFKRLQVSYSEFQEQTNSSDADSDIEETELFHYDYRTLDIAQEGFEDLYVSSIVKFFNELKPYKEATEVLDSKNAFDKNSNLYEALITKNRSNANLKDSYSEAKKLLETQFNGKYYLLYSVLGQKTLFSLFFKRIDAFQKANLKEDEILVCTDKFICDINHLLEILNCGNKPLFGEKGTITIRDSNLDEEISDLTVATSFWEGIIYQDKRIIYNSQGISSFSSFFEYLLAFVEAYESHSEGTFRFSNNFDINFMSRRIQNSLKRNVEGLDDIEIESIAKKIIGSKKKFISSYLKKCVDKSRQ